jgi:uncharacterized GH25 family protein
LKQNLEMKNEPKGKISMKSNVLAFVLLALAASPARSHFIWIVPDGANAGLMRVFFSDKLEPDDQVPIEKIAATRLLIRAGAGKITPLAWKKDEHAYRIDLPAQQAAVVGGTCRYGVFQRGQAKPFLLFYYPKVIRGAVPDPKLGDQLPMEIVPKGPDQFQVLFDGKPAGNAEVVVLPPDEKEQTQTADGQGHFQFKTPKRGSCYGIRARFIEAKSGQLDGKKYDEIRHYATLVVRIE